MKTPQPTPPSLSSIQTPTPSGTREHISILREHCLLRDRHRCVISRKFDRHEASKRFDRYGEDSKDDDGNLLRDEVNKRFSFLEVAHILPHSLVTVASADTELVSKINAFESTLLISVLERIKKKRTPNSGYV